MANRVATKNTLKYMMGICMPSIKSNAVKVRIPNYEFDDYLLMYLKKNDFIYATDPENKAQVGDTVLIRNLEKPLTRLITHKIIDVVYSLGDITDPITGKKVVCSQYRHDMQAIIEQYGKLDSAFDYSKAPPRGAVANTRDFTYEETYEKYNEYPDKPQPYAIDKY